MLAQGRPLTNHFSSLTSRMHFLLSALRLHPELAIYLAVSLGFLIGRVRIAGFTLGSVTGVLITALVIGQLDIPVSPG
jgi:putative transport protein